MTVELPVVPRTPWLWEIPVGARPGMRVPGLVYADEALMSVIRRDGSLEQVANAATLPGIVHASLAMPDIHLGYGLPVGGVVATDAESGVVSPGGVGYDINCGVRLLATRLDRSRVEGRLPALADALASAIPAGVGAPGPLRLSPAQIRRGPARDGAAWAVAQGQGTPADLERIESGGRLEGADPDGLSDRACQRARDQLGTLGSGNHFVELQVVDEVRAPEAAATLGLAEGRVTLMIHTGSRGLGHQVCTDALGQMPAAMRRHGITLPDRQLACAPVEAPEARAYLGAMRAAANFAFANRQWLAGTVGDVMARTLAIPPFELGLALVYDVAHNVAKEEHHHVDGRLRRLMVHRKGATRAFPPGHPELPAAYRTVGQPVLIPGDMGRYSYVLTGLPGAMTHTFGSTCHGAGRVMSRTAAVRAARGRSIAEELSARGIVARASGRGSLAEEMPDAYKDVREVVGVVERAGLSRVVCRLRPLAVVKG